MFNENRQIKALPNAICKLAVAIFTLSLVGCVKKSRWVLMDPEYPIANTLQFKDLIDQIQQEGGHFKNHYKIGSLLLNEFFPEKQVSRELWSVHHLSGTSMMTDYQGFPDLDHEICYGQEFTGMEVKIQAKSIVLKPGLQYNLVIFVVAFNKFGEHPSSMRLRSTFYVETNTVIEPSSCVSDTHQP